MEERKMRTLNQQTATKMTDEFRSDWKLSSVEQDIHLDINRFSSSSFDLLNRQEVMLYKLLNPFGKQVSDDIRHAEPKSTISAAAPVDALINAVDLPLQNDRLALLGITED